MEEGEDRSETTVGLKWQTRVDSTENGDFIQCHHPSRPYNITIRVGKEFTSIYLDTGEATDCYDTCDKMRLYKALLKKNLDYNLVQIVLIGEYDNVAFAVDFDLSGLSKEEIEFVTKCLKENKPLPDSYRYIIPFETKKEHEPDLFSFYRTNKSGIQ